MSGFLIPIIHPSKLEVVTALPPLVMPSYVPSSLVFINVIPELDAGPYLLQEKIRIEKNDNFVSLSKKLSDLGSRLILESLDLIEKKNYKFTDQDIEKATYAKKIDKKESEINWNETSSKILSKIA